MGKKNNRERCIEGKKDRVVKKREESQMVTKLDLFHRNVGAYKGPKLK